MRITFFNLSLYCSSLLVLLAPVAIAEPIASPPGPRTPSCFCPAKECREAGVQCQPPSELEGYPQTYPEPTMCLFGVRDNGERYCVPEFYKDIYVCPYLIGKNVDDCPVSHSFVPKVCAFDDNGHCSLMNGPKIKVFCSGGVLMEEQDGFAPSAQGQKACASCLESESACRKAACEGHVIDAKRGCTRGAPQDTPCQFPGKQPAPESSGAPLPSQNNTGLFATDVFSGDNT
jgi:hypothetical protein